MDKMTIGVVGAGAMGAGIAQVAAQNGHEVILYDTKYAALESARHRYEKIFARLVEKGKWSQEKSEEVFGRIHFENHLDKFENCGLIIEAIIENLDVKKSVFNALEDICSKDCVLATNTSSLSIAAISSAVQHPERILGVHSQVHLTGCVLHSPGHTREGSEEHSLRHSRQSRERASTLPDARDRTSAKYRSEHLSKTRTPH